MSSYSYYYVKTIVEDGQPSKTYKFAKGYPVQATKDAWATLGRYNLSSRLLRGGLSGSGDVYHPANTTFKLIERGGCFTLFERDRRDDAARNMQRGMYGD